MNKTSSEYMTEKRQFEINASEADFLKILRKMIPLEQIEDSPIAKSEQAIIERAICYIEELNSILLANP